MVKAKKSRRYDGAECRVVDLTVSSRHLLHEDLNERNGPSAVRRVRRRGDKGEVGVEPSADNSFDHPTVRSKVTYISGVKLFFQSFIRQYPRAALIVWATLCFLEFLMVVLYITQTIHESNGDTVSWYSYGREWSIWFWCRVVLSSVLLLQLLFATLSFYTIVIIVLTTAYQLVIFIAAVSAHLGFLTNLYVPFFLRCWPMRQYFLFVLDSIALMKPKRRKLHLIRLAAGPLTLFLCLAFTAAAAFHIDQTFRGHPLNIGASLYFIFVTVSTVGYGDIVPHTFEGKLIVIIFVFLFLSKMPTFIAVFHSATSIYKAYRNYEGSPQHFIVIGNVTSAEVFSILDEILSLYPSKVVVFANTSFSSDVLLIAASASYRMRCDFIVFDSLDTYTFKRLRVRDACSIVLLPMKPGHSPRVDDDVMLASCMLKRHFPDLEQHVWLRFGIHAGLLHNNTIMIEEHVKRTVLATALILPGVIPFIVNLIRSAWAGGSEPEELWSSSGMWDWRNQYKYSRRQVMIHVPCPVEAVSSSLLDITVRMKRHDILVLGVITFAGEQMLLRLDYELMMRDQLVLLYHPSYYPELSTGNPLPLSLIQECFQSNLSSPVMPTSDDGAESLDLYPYGVRPVDDLDDEFASASFNDSFQGITFTAESLVECLLSLNFTNKKPNGVPLERLTLSGSAIATLTSLLQRHSAARDDPYCPHAESERLENIINNTLRQLAYISTSETAPVETNLATPTEIFVFIDQTASIFDHSLSVYETILSQSISEFQLHQMMRCVHSIHPESSAVLLTLQKFSKSFLLSWKDYFGSPLQYIRGQPSVSAHLNYALTNAADPTRVRGILLFCSQMGQREFTDVPVWTVLNNVRELATTYADAQNAAWEHSELHIVVEIEAFSSCTQIAPLHRDPEWLIRGKDNFQECLSFIMGRCFAANMLITLPFHAHRERALVPFLMEVLQLRSAAEVFDEAEGIRSLRQSHTRFRVCGNHVSQFACFGDAFEFLLSRKLYISIGVFRLFPQKEKLDGEPRYFISNIPYDAPLATDDIIYCLDTGAASNTG